MKKRSVSAKALVEDIRNGLSDAELMNRYQINSDQLRKSLVRLKEARYLAQEELDGRRREETKTASMEPGAGTQLGKDHASALSLPMSSEQASRVRRNGLILILVSFGFVTMAIILAELRKGGELGVFPLDDLGVALAFLTPVGAIVSAVLGFLWRVRGLGQHAAWALMAPLFCVTVVVLEALPNRYEPHSDVRALRLAFAVSGLVAWWIAMSQVAKHL